MRWHGVAHTWGCGERALSSVLFGCWLVHGVRLGSIAVWFCMCVLCGQGALIVLWVLAFALGSVVLLRGAPVPAMAHRAIVH
jgi:hypothetical protein